MASRDRDKYRSYASGHQKRLKKQKIEKLIDQQRGAIDKFINNKEISDFKINETYDEYTKLNKEKKK